MTDEPQASAGAVYPGPAHRPHRGQIHGLAIASVAVFLLLLVVLVPPPPWPGAATGGDSAVALAQRATFTNVTYKSSVDGWPLSYLEWLPAGFTARQSFPLAVFLHGVGSPGPAIRGGGGGQAVIAPNTGIVANASSSGYLLISINTRSLAGFYVNSPCTGPQEQDVLDAIAHEKAVRSVASVSLIGFSMGSLGALSIAGHNPGLIRNVALAGTITDAFEALGFASTTSPGLVNAWRGIACGVLPSPKNAVLDATYSYLSVARFAPSNLSSIRVYVTAGGRDPAAPNDFGLWPYAQANSTFVNSSCAVVSKLGEPSQCTTPWSVLHASHPTLYNYRFVYESTAPHSVLQLAAGDAFAFWAGLVGGGPWITTFPPSTFHHG